VKQRIVEICVGDNDEVASLRTLREAIPKIQKWSRVSCCEKGRGRGDRGREGQRRLTWIQDFLQPTPITELPLNGQKIKLSMNPQEIEERIWSEIF
jgi:hypothetical protein